MVREATLHNGSFCHVAGCFRVTACTDGVKAL